MENKLSHQQIITQIPFVKDIPPWLRQVLSYVLAPMLALMSFALIVMVFVNIFGFGLSSFMGFNAKPEDLQIYTLILAGFLGAPFIVWQTATAHKTARIEENRLVSERLSKAYEQLGAERIIKFPMKNKEGEMILNSDQTPIFTETVEPDISLRRAAIQTLKNIAKINESEHIDIMECLCAYIRENAKSKTIDDEESKLKSWDWDRSTPHLRADIKEALVAIGSRSEARREYERDKIKNGRNEEFCLDLSDVDLRGAKLNNLNFDYALFIGADLSETNISSTSLISADLTGAKLIKAVICKDSRLKDTCLRNAKMDYSYFHDVEFQGLDITSASLEGAAFRKTDMSIIQYPKNSFEVEKLIRNSFGDSSVKLPDAIKRPAQWIDTVLEEGLYHGHLRGWLELKGIVWPARHKETVPPIPPTEGCSWSND